MILTFSDFGGIAPGVDPVNLPANGAQVAENCRLQSGGSVEPYKTTLKVYPATGVIAGGTVKSIYRFDRETASNTEWWFTFDADTDVAKGQIAGDTTERTYYTSEAHEPRYTYSGLAEAGGIGPFPVNHFKLGVPAPTTAAGVTKSGTPDVGTTPELRFYVYTFVTTDGQESAPSPVSLSIEWSQGETVQLLNIDAFPAGNYDFTGGKVRIYRTATGSSSTIFQFVAEVSNTALSAASPARSWLDTVNSLGEELLTTGWKPPPSTLRGLVSLPNGVMAGFVGQDLYLTPPYTPYAWPDRYRQTFDLPIVGLAAFGNSLAVLTIGEPYIVSGSDPELMGQQGRPVPYSCASKRSIQKVGDAILYASPQGIVSLSDAGISLVTQGYFTQREWEAFKPETMLGASYDGLYIVFYDKGGGDRGGIVFDPRNKAVTTTSLFATAAFADSVNNALFLCIAQEIHRFEGGASVLSMRWKGKKQSIPQPGSFGWAQVVADTYPVTFKAWADGVQVGLTKTVTSAAPFRLAVGHGRYWEAEVSAATGRVRAIHFAHEARELAGV